ncbi:adenosylcobinamide-GDP ribazoletransferase [Desmospora profundinema]|uniref:Adenosylcobinamide-GDP ribazoletransferase n=1 Tax=Desmospora profundinema TaxID=1571184 RepID=A0ABU1INI8_9BACL|nr:adenosylcobinamide-GDP ribazoletransferase [Desmospora profundinema]MDR6226102.1 adenosylcobinamide-GDP ribazoletransferase [Desmospora profundinema]
MNVFFTALAFLTRIPAPVSSDRDDWAKSPCHYPLVGLILGGAFVLFDQAVGSLFPSLVRGAMLTVLWVYLTGGLHLDGLMDTADGFGANRGPERTLEIMKDSRVGAMGVLTAFSVLLLKFSVLVSLADDAMWVALVAAPVAGRLALVLSIRLFPYVKKDGIGLGMKENLTPWRLVYALGIGIGAFFLTTGWWGTILLTATLLVVWIIGQSARSRLRGLTGDIYGATAEITEVVVLLLCLWYGGVR